MITQYYVLSTQLLSNKLYKHETILYIRVDE